MRPELLKEIISRYMAANFTITRRIGAMLREIMPEFITEDQYMILQFIKDKSEQSTTSTELASIFCVGKSTITAIVARMEAKGWILRQEDARDRRVTRLLLTEEGLRLATELTARIESILAHYLNEFEDEDSERFIQPFEKLAKLLSEPDERRETER
ncbi:MarR family winged helix-turn-helix transcriptional regulator [Gorillibacterium timonense]|uniref:MarR family winged helix-turn-helix transcriptional regulator n=1 Tax=Gorillibacterium timonense TaxID=1689269 RepID=UPI00071E5CBD|nr:MarR family transcriptional regulator [Gorillibacterium timonense]